MITLQGIEGLHELPQGCVLSIGNFDGMHRGHAGILQEARQLKESASGAALAVVTFEPHPLTVLRPEAAPPRLTPAAIKAELIEQAGADYLVLLPPAPAVLDLTAEQFWALLRDRVRPNHLVEGRNFTFGKGRGGTIDRLRDWSAGTGITLHVTDPVSVPLLNLHVVPVSSSLIRWLLSYGRVRDAAICLGRAYMVEGEVIKGHQRGRTIVVPTANLKVEEQLVPADGVYVGRCKVDGIVYSAAVSIGTMPTFGENQRQVEAHLLGFSGDLYGRVLRVGLVDWLRDQWKLPGVEALKEQIARDVDAVKKRSGMQSERLFVKSS